MLTDRDIERYGRQIRLPGFGPEGQEKLARAKVLVVGAGGLGSPVLEYLVAAGVGSIGIVEYELIDLSNLNRQVLYEEKEIGQPKVIQAAERLRRTNGNIEIRPWFEKLRKENVLEIFSFYDLVVDCTDQFPVRYLMADASILLDKPVVYGAVYQFEGQVTVFNYRGGPTLRCLQPEQPHPMEVPSCAEGGIVGFVAGVIGCLQAGEVIKILLGMGDVLSGKLLVYNGLDCSFHSFSLERSTEPDRIKELGDYPEACLPEGLELKTLTKRELQQWISEGRPCLVINVSDPSDRYDPGFPSVHIPSYEIASKLTSLSRDIPIILACPMGIKSRIVANYLVSREGYQDVWVLGL